MVIYISFLNYKTKAKKKALSYVQSACDESSVCVYIYIYMSVCV